MQLRIKAEYINGFLCIDTTNIPDDLHDAALREAQRYFYKENVLEDVFEFDRKVVYKVIKDLKK